MFCSYVSLPGEFITRICTERDFFKSEVARQSGINDTLIEKLGAAERDIAALRDKVEEERQKLASEAHTKELVRATLRRATCILDDEHDKLVAAEKKIKALERQVDILEDAALAAAAPPPPTSSKRPRPEAGFFALCNAREMKRRRLSWASSK